MVVGRSLLAGLACGLLLVGCSAKEDLPVGPGSTGVGSTTAGATSTGSVESSSGQMSATSAPGSSSSVGETSEMEPDAFCRQRDAEQSCLSAMLGGVTPCDWVVRYEFPPDSCDVLEAIEECRAVSVAGDGCGGVVGSPGCESGGPLLHNNGDSPMYRENEDGSVSLVVGTMCAPPPGFAECEPVPSGNGEFPVYCTCLCQ